MISGNSEYGFVRSYAFASLVVIVVLMIFLGWWVNRAIQVQVIKNTAANVALYVQSFIAPELQGLGERDFLTEQEMVHIEKLLRDTPLGKKIRSVKIWKEGGHVIYYSRRSLIGQHFEPTQNLKQAWLGEVTAEFDELNHEEDSEEAKLNVPLLEIYSPVRQQGRERIIAVAEFYQDAALVAERLRDTEKETWLVVSLATLTAYGLLYMIVRHGGGIIRRQRRALHHQVSQLTGLLEENQLLGKQLKQAFRKTTENNEKLLQRVSADLHDGPAQYMGLALLRLDALRSGDLAVECENNESIVGEVRGAIQDSLTELRNISRGLALPDLEGMTLQEVIENAIKSHARRTSSVVESYIDLKGISQPPGILLKITAFRAVQEALSNAYRHAGAKGQRVEARSDGVHLDLVISDEGKGFDCGEIAKRDGGLGLMGLRERIKGIGGEFEVSSVVGAGTSVKVRLPLKGEDGWMA
ncbi:MAG: ATP-binding protein [Sedimenticolaceae bacterium]